MADTVPLSLLHSNDLHGDFWPAFNDEPRATGGIARLADYVQQTREPAKHAGSVNAVLRDYLSAHPGMDSHVESRLTVLG